MSGLPKHKIGFLCLLFAVITCLTGCKEDAAPPQTNVQVTYFATRFNDVPLVTEMPGRVSAFLVSEVRPQVSGIIQKRLFEEGTDVKEGQQLYQIDPALFEAAYNSAKAELSKAKANAVSARLLAQRYSKIVDINAVSKQEYDDAVAARDQAAAAVNAAKQAVETARINLEYTKVLSPVSGRIGRSFVTPGALVTQNQANPLTTVQQLSPVYVDVTQSSAELLKLRRSLAQGEVQDGTHRGTKIKLRLEDGSLYARIGKKTADGKTDSEIFGELLFSDVTIEQSTGVVTIRATFENPDNILLPGMYVRAVIEEGVRENTILVPQKTVMRDTRNKPYVYVLTKENPVVSSESSDQEESSAKALGSSDYYVATRYIALDRDYKNNWLVTDGLKPGDLVLVDGQQKVRVGQVVSGEAVFPESLKDALRAIEGKDDKSIEINQPDTSDQTKTAEKKEAE